MNFTRKWFSSCLALSMMSPAFGLEYTLQPEVQARATHEDNIRLTPTDPISLQGREVIASVESQAAGETWQAALDIELDFNSYNRDEYDSDDQLMGLNFNKNTERQNFGIRGKVIRDSTRTSEIETSGQIGLKARRRESYSVTPYWSYLVNSSNKVSIEGSLYTVDYAGDNSQFTDYDYNTVSASWFTAVNESLTLQFNVVDTAFETDLVSASIYVPALNSIESLGEYGAYYHVESDGLQLQVGGEYRLTEQFVLTGLVGKTSTEQRYVVEPASACGTGVVVGASLLGPVYARPDQCALDDYDESSVTGELGVSWSGERSTLSALYSIKNEPVSRGYEIESEKARLNWKYRLSKLNHFELKFLYGQTEAVDISATALNPEVSNRDFINANLIYRHRLTETWNFRAEGAYRWQERETTLGDAESYLIKLGITYRPVESIWSR